MEVGVRLPRLLREQRFVFSLCLFANFLASHVCLALRLYNAPINWVSQAVRQPGKPGRQGSDGSPRMFQMFDKRAAVLPADTTHTY